MRIRVLRREQPAAETAQEPTRPEFVEEGAKCDEIRGYKGDAYLHKLPEEGEAHDS